MTTGFHFRNVSRTYPTGTVALQDFTLSVESGERVSLIGPSGCGKSTALRLLAGLDAPDSGVIEKQTDATLGYVFQDPVLLPWATVFDNIYMPLRLLGQSREHAAHAINALIEIVGLSEFAQAYPRELSGGMKMRVSIARALIKQPSLLLLDEPFAALDEITRFKLNDLLLELQKRDGFTLLFVTHSMFESVYLTDRIAVMSHRPGRVFAEIATPGGDLMGAAYRASKTYLASCTAVSNALASAMNEPDYSGNGTAA